MLRNVFAWGLFALAMLAVLTQAGCETYPLGMSKDEWVLLSPQQQAEAQQKQEAIDAEQRRVAAEAEAARRQAAAAEAAQRQAELEHRYRHARFGDIVSVNIEGGTMKFAGKDRRYEPVAFDLIRGEAKEVVIERVDRRDVVARVVVRLSEDGRTLYFDDASDKRLRLTEKSWGAPRGEVYPNQSLNNDNSDLRDATFTVRYRAIRR